MDPQEKIKLARQVMQIAGIFSVVVAMLLVINFLQTRKYEPLESKTLNAMVERLEDDPGNEKLMEEIREFDLIVRKAYFTSQWQINTGAILLIIGTVIFAVALKIYFDLRRGIDRPEDGSVSMLQNRKTSVRWLGAAGGVLLVMALLSAWFSNDYLEDYYAGKPGSAIDSTARPDESIEIVTITEDIPGAGQDTVETAGAAKGDPGAGTAEVSAGPETAGPEAAGEKESVYGITEFRKHHNTFRGPLGQGIVYHANIPTDWEGASGRNVRWKVALSKPGYNSPVIWGDRLFLSGADEQARVVSCFDRNTGELLWERKADNIPGSPAKMPKVTDDTGLAAPTVAADGYRVYAIFATGDIIAFSLDGERAWARNLGVPRNHYGHSSSLLVWNNKVIVQYDTGAGGRMLALNGQTGETVWDVRRDNNISWASPVLIDHAGKIQVVTNTDPLVAGHDVETGEEIWSLSVMMGEVGPSVAYDDGVVFANNEYASLVAINAEPGAEIIWESYDYLSEAASPVAHDGLLYLATSYGVLVCYDAATGEEVWQMELNASVYSSPMIAEGRIYLMDNSGVMHIIRADRSATKIGAPELGEPSWAIPAFAPGRIYIRGAESLYCIGN